MNYIEELAKNNFKNIDNQNLIKYLKENYIDNKNSNLDDLYFTDDKGNNISHVITNKNIFHILNRINFDFNRKNNCGETPLIKACKKSFSSDVITILVNKSDVNNQNDNGDFALLYADSEATKIILSKHDVDVNLKNNDGYNALFDMRFYERNSIFKSVENQEDTYKEKMNLLLQKGIQKNIVSEGGDSPYLFANDECFEVLLNNKVPYKPNEILLSEEVLMFVLKQNNYRKLKLLLDDDIDINHLEALTFIFENISHPFGATCFNLFIEKGLNVKKMEEDGLFNKASDMASFDNEIHSMRHPFILCDSNAVKYLIDLGLNINHVDDAGRNALFYSDFRKSEVLLSNGIDMNTIDKNGENALFMHFRENKFSGRIKLPTDKLELLLKSGINNKIINNDGNNCAWGANKEFLEIFKKYGVDLHYVNNNNENLLFSVLNNKDSVLFLVDNGIDPLLKNDKNENALSKINKNIVESCMALMSAKERENIRKSLSLDINISIVNDNKRRL